MVNIFYMKQVIPNPLSHKPFPTSFCYDYTHYALLTCLLIEKLSSLCLDEIRKDDIESNEI